LVRLGNKPNFPLSSVDQASKAESGMSTTDIGVIGLGVMGVNLALNLGDRGFRLSVYNRTAAVTATRS
jgi:glutamyl-tRNA reductase